MGYISKLVRKLPRVRARLLAYLKIIHDPQASHLVPSAMAAVFLLLAVPSVFVGATGFTPGSYVGMPANTCNAANDSWLNATNAAGRPTLTSDAEATAFGSHNAAALVSSKDSLVCEGYATPQQRRQQPGLGLSISTVSSNVDKGQGSDKHIDSAAFLLDKSFQLKQPTSPSDATSLDGIIRIDISTDKGATWQPLHIINESALSNATNGGYLGVSLPANVSAAFNDLSVRVQGLREGDTSTQVYIDSIFLTYQVAPSQRLALKPAVRLDSKKPVFTVNQPAAFKLEVDRQGEGIVQGIVSQFSSDDPQPDVDITMQVRDAKGRTVKGVETSSTWKGKALNGNDVWDISLEQPAIIAPGTHTATVTITDDAGNMQSVKQDFLWGVLAINTHKSMYQAGETVHFDMAVLNEKGEMTCDAYMELLIEGPHSAKLSTDDGTITANKECQEKQIVEKPDYSGQWEIPKAPVGDDSGTYKLTLTAKTANGSYTITDSFRVGDPEAVTVTRAAPTRIMPANRYTVRMKVVAEQQDFTGTITETLPSSFTLSRYDTLYEYVDGSPSKAIAVNTTVASGPSPGEQTITWHAALKKGTAYELRYAYKAPDISPEFYLTGPLTFMQQQNTVFAEHRQWHIASDAPWLVGWQYRKQITIDQTKVDGDLTDFPVAVKLNSTNFDFSKARSDGFDIRFTSSDMTTTLSYERERHNTGSQLAEYWVKLPNVSGSVDTVFYMYYGNSSAADGQTGSVWDTSHQGVWHLKENPGTTCSGTFEACDSSAQVNHADALGSMNASDQVTGMVGTGIQFDGTNDYLQAGDSNNVDGSSRLTISAWVRLDTLRDWSTILSKVSSFTSYFAMQTSTTGQGGNNDISVTVANGSDNAGYTSGNILSTGIWNYWTIAFDGTATGNNNRLKFYLNGQQQTLTYTGTVPATTASNTTGIRIGDDTGGGILAGTLDEVRLSNNTRSPEWIKASYHGDNGTLLTLGSEEIANESAGTPEYGATPMFHNARVGSAAPSLGTFWSTDPDGDMVQYEVQWDDDPTFSSPVTRSSADHATNGFTAASFDGQYEPTSYVVQPGEALTNGTTYWWRVRAMDIGAGTNEWSAYSSPIAFTVNTSIGAVNQWHETTDEQFDDDALTSVRTFGSENVSLTPLTYRYIRWEITGRRGPSANSIQAAEFVLRHNNASVAWPAGTIATNPGGNSPSNETPPFAIDGVVSGSKWLDFNFNLSNNSSLTGSSVLVIDTGAGNSVTFSGYYWATANDFPERDPVTWNVYGSNDGTDWSLVDARSNQTITTTRHTFIPERVIDPRFSYRYLQFAITKRRGAADGIQLSELQLLNNGSGVAWPSGTTASSPGATYNAGEEPSRLIDNSTSTKFLDSAFSSDGTSTAGNTVITIDTGANKSIRFDDYRWATANDANARDPVSWKLSGSNDGTNWTTLDIKEDYATTTSRTTYTSALDTLAEPGGVMSEPILFSNVSQAENWNQLSAATTEPSSSNVLIRVYYATSGTACNTRVPDVALAGNSSGFDISAGPVNLAGLNTTTYSVLCVGASLRPGSATISPSLNDWTVTWDRNTEPSIPTAVGQTRTDTSTIATGTWINENTVRFTATAGNTETGEAIQLCVEAQPLGVAFTGTETGCGSGVTYSGTPVSLTATLNNLSNHTEYHWQAWTKDIGNVHNFPSSPVAYGANAESERDFAVDTTAPTGGTVYDGTVIGVDASLNDGSLSSLSANWSGFDASASGLVRYEYSIGTTIGGTQVRGWTNANTATSVTATGLTLQTSQAYYFNVRAVDAAGNTQSPVITSSGQLVAPSLSFAAAPATMTFSNLNPGNNYTDAKTTTLTTSTNAYGGYIVRLASTDYLRDEVSSLPAFNGGTYDFPDSWQTGDIGFGYTSSDTNVQGVNRFQATTCPGGSALSAPGCYAPYSQAKPGDIIADHVAAISGAPLTNQQFTITHRVTASSTQRASTYSVVLLYAATAMY